MIAVKYEFFADSFFAQSDQILASQLRIFILTLFILIKMHTKYIFAESYFCG